MSEKHKKVMSFAVKEAPTPIIEEMVEEFWKRYGASDERKDWLRNALTTIYQNAREEEREAWMKGKRCFMCGKEMLNPDGLSNTCARCFEEA